MERGVGVGVRVCGGECVAYATRVLVAVAGPADAGWTPREVPGGVVQHARSTAPARTMNRIPGFMAFSHGHLVRPAACAASAHCAPPPPRNPLRTRAPLVEDPGDLPGPARATPTLFSPRRAGRRPSRHERVGGPEGAQRGSTSNLRPQPGAGCPGIKGSCDGWRRRSRRTASHPRSRPMLARCRKQSESHSRSN